MMQVGFLVATTQNKTKSLSKTPFSVRFVFVSDLIWLYHDPNMSVAWFCQERNMFFVFVCWFCCVVCLLYLIEGRNYISRKEELSRRPRGQGGREGEEERGEERREREKEGRRGGAREERGRDRRDGAKARRRGRAPRAPHEHTTSDPQHTPRRGQRRSPEPPRQAGPHTTPKEPASIRDKKHGK